MKFPTNPGVSIEVTIPAKNPCQIFSLVILSANLLVNIHLRHSNHQFSGMRKIQRSKLTGCCKASKRNVLSAFNNCFQSKNEKPAKRISFEKIKAARGIFIALSKIQK